MMVIFCWTQVDTKTRTGMIMGDGSGTERSIHKKCGFMGAAAKATENGATGYIFSASPTSLSGVLNRVCINTRNKPKRMGIWITMGPKHPMGLTPDSR